MFDISFGEITVIIIIGLIVLGPDKLPGVIRSSIKIIHQLRSMFLGVKNDIEKELNLNELVSDVKNSIKDTSGVASLSELKQEMSTLTNQVKFDAQKHLMGLESELKSSMKNEPSDFGKSYFDKLAQPTIESDLLDHEEDKSTDFDDFSDYIAIKSNEQNIGNPNVRFLRLLQARQAELALKDEPLALFVQALKNKQAQADILAEHEWMQLYCERLRELNGDVIFVPDDSKSIHS